MVWPCGSGRGFAGVGVALLKWVLPLSGWEVQRCVCRFRSVMTMTPGYRRAGVG